MESDQWTAAFSSILYSLNTIYGLSSLGLGAVGVLARYYWYGFNVFPLSEVEMATGAVVVVGVSIFVITSVSSLAAANNSLLCLRICAIILGWLVIGQIECRIAAGLYKGKTEKKLESSMRQSLKTYFESNSSKLVWDQLQSKEECCGVDNYFDWVSHFGFAPDSCQSIGSQNDTSFEAGCYQRIMADIDYGFHIYEIVNSIGIVLGIQTALYELLYVRINKNIEEESESSSSSSS